jgi:hypothetical protein
MDPSTAGAAQTVFWNRARLAFSQTTSRWYLGPVSLHYLETCKATRRMRQLCVLRSLRGCAWSETASCSNSSRFAHLLRALHKLCMPEATTHLPLGFPPMLFDSGRLMLAHRCLEFCISYLNYDRSIDRSINHLGVDYRAIQVGSVLIVRDAGDHAPCISSPMNILKNTSSLPPYSRVESLTTLKNPRNCPTLSG